MSGEGGSVERVRAALLAAGHADTIRAFPEGTRTAADAAAAIGCDVAQIAKSIVFRAGERAVVAMASGADRVDAKKVAAASGLAVKRADAEFVRAATGFAIGGVSPVGHTSAPVLLMDEALFALHPLWAAAGSPMHVFETEAVELLRITGAVRCDVAEGREGLPSRALPPGI
jgi:prolyl-tRNA editing enzyme YbaK/EbsC (Cys-tRNA(Pro) deacylase)